MVIEIIVMMMMTMMMMSTMVMVMNGGDDDNDEDDVEDDRLDHHDGHGDCDRVPDDRDHDRENDPDDRDLHVMYDDHVNLNGIVSGDGGDAYKNSGSDDADECNDTIPVGGGGPYSSSRGRSIHALSFDEDQCSTRVSVRYSPMFRRLRRFVFHALNGD